MQHLYIDNNWCSPIYKERDEIGLTDNNNSDLR